MNASASHPRSPTQPDALLVVLWLLFWVLMMGVALRDYGRGGGHDWWKPILWEGSAMLTSTVLLLLQRRASPHFAPLLGHPWRWIAAHLKWLPALGVLHILAFYGIRHAVYTAVGQTYTHEPWPQVFAYEGAKVLLFACLWLGVIFSMESHAHWQAQQQRLLMLQRSLSEARLAQLSAQLRPHFLFNALNTVSALMAIDVARADRLLSTLGELLRASLQTSPQQVVPLHEELHLLRLYAQVMTERFADRVTLEWRVDPSAEQALVPALLLQPLLENAFKHGVERRSGPVSIRIEACGADGHLRLTVSNTGALEGATADTAGIGLRNTRDRLVELYGSEASFDLRAAGGEVQAQVRLPFHQEARA